MILLLRYTPRPGDNKANISCSVVNQLYPSQPRQHRIMLTVRCKIKYFKGLSLVFQTTLHLKRLIPDSQRDHKTLF